MKVTLLNPEETKNLFVDWGMTSKVCYGTPVPEEEPERSKKLAGIGKHCMRSGHFSGSRGSYIKFQIDEAPRFMLDQLYRQEIGVFKNMASFRYIDKDGFLYDLPDEIVDNPELVKKYDIHMFQTAELYSEIQDYVYQKTGKHERANEQARYVLPMSTLTAGVIGFSPEAFIHLMNVRLCVRAEDRIQELARLMREAVLEVLPELKPKLVPSCQALLWCPEGKQSCGAYPTREELQKVWQKHKPKSKEEV